MTRHADDMKRRIADHLKDAMADCDISSAELARRLGLNEKTIRRWRNAEVMPDTEKLAQAAGALGYTLDFFYAPLHKAEAAA